jgi:hypothetical protein
LISPTPGGDLLLYVLATQAAVSAVLVQEQETNHSKQQIPVYYVSEALSGSKSYYSEIEKMAYTVLTTSRKLKHYFQAHKIRVLINYPLNLHKGICGTHPGARTMAGKAFRQGFYWPSAQNNSKKIVKSYYNCQMSASKTKAPTTNLRTIEPTWPLARWGIDIIEKLSAAQGNLQYAVVAVEYFTKWIKAKPVTNMLSFTMKKFLWQNIICCFRVLRHITVDNGTQFDSQNFREYYESLGIQLCFASVKHPQSNGAVERANGIICTGISKCLVGLPKGKCVDELPKVV